MKYFQLPIRQNIIETEDDYIQYEQQKKYEFIDLGQTVYFETKEDNQSTRKELLKIEFFIDD